MSTGSRHEPLAPQTMVSRTVQSFEASQAAKAAVASIVRGIGLPLNLEVRASPGIDNAQALVELVAGREVRLILYNPVWMEKLQGALGDDWLNISITAHEIGHHLSGHLDPAYANHAAELEADYFSGFVMNRMNATLEQARLAIAVTSTDDATDSHPGRIQCMQAMTAGWTEARVGGFAKLHRSSRTQKPMFWLYRSERAIYPMR